MRDYVERVKALRHCASVHDCVGCEYGCDTNGLPRNRDLLNDDADAIEELLAVVPKRGEWITTRTWEHDGDPYCSLCGFENCYTANSGDFKYCPSCGARMKGADG